MMSSYDPTPATPPPASRPGAASPARASDEVFQGPTSPGSQGQKGSSGMGIALGCIGCGALAVIGCVVAIIGFFHFGAEILAEAVGESLRDHPVVIEHIGRIEEIDTETMKSIAAEGETFVYRVTGDKGSGTLRVVSISHEDGSEEVVSGVLLVDGGPEIDLFPDGLPSEMESPGVQPPTGEP